MSVIWLYVPQGRDRGFGQGQVMQEAFLEKYIHVRQYQIVPQTDTGG